MHRNERVEMSDYEMLVRVALAKNIFFAAFLRSC